jgi:hypothetical protein
MQIKPAFNAAALEAMRQNTDRESIHSGVRYAIRKSPYAKKPSLDDYDQSLPANTKKRNNKWNQ